MAPALLASSWLPFGAIVVSGGGTTKLSRCGADPGSAGPSSNRLRRASGVVLEPDDDVSLRCRCIELYVLDMWCVKMNDESEC